MLPEAGSLWLLKLLRDIQLAQFYWPILEELNVTRPEHFDFVKPEDLDGIGMGRPALILASHSSAQTVRSSEKATFRA
ncbi:TNK1 isoform 7 [Pongo abelii]|uniref:non-specific protein-tyrosine kinase n=1 Tax=Pongo abelii TaxID=9601 RepID=A0A2J8RWU7_PONAB|nr:TNK1 isoform 7 [Pongo abelii]